MIASAVRVWFAATVLAVLVGLTIQIPVTATATGGFFDTPAARVGNLFTFFTIQSNVLVALTCVLLALNPRPTSTFLRTLRLDALLGIVVAGIVYHVVLAPLDSFTGAEWYANQIFHSVVPPLAVLGWLVAGPRRGIDGRVVAWSLVFPVGWLAFTLVRGALIGWYPYPFVDVIELGYGRVALNCLLVAALFLGLAAAFLGLDRLLGRARRPLAGSPA